MNILSRDEMQDIVNHCEFDNYRFTVHLVRAMGVDGYYLQAQYVERDIVTGLPELQKTRKWLLSRHMTKSEIVQTAFKCCMTSMEHRARETFKYNGRRIFGPHFDVDALHQICSDKHFDYRQPEGKETA